MEVDRRFFDGLMQDKGLSLRGLAKRMQLGHSQLSLTFSGDRKMQLSEAVQLSGIFGVPLAQIIRAMGVDAAQVGETRVSVIGSVSGDGTVTVHDHDTVERTTAPTGVPDDGLAVQFKTAGTPLDFLDAAVMFSAKPDGVALSVLGRLCLVQVTGGPMAVAAVRRGYQEASFNLFGLHRRENIRLDWASPILFTRH